MDISNCAPNLDIDLHHQPLRFALQRVKVRKSQNKNSGVFNSSKSKLKISALAFQKWANQKKRHFIILNSHDVFLIQPLFRG